MSKKDKTRQDKTRQDIYYRNITSTIVWHAVSKKMLVEVCQINSITNQILYYNKYKAKKKKRRNMCNEFKRKKDKSEEKKARKTNLSKLK